MPGPPKVTVTGKDEFSQPHFGQQNLESTCFLPMIVDRITANQT